MDKKNIAVFLFYFAASAFLTICFILLCPLYISNQQILFSTGIAGGKWAIQIIIGLYFLKEKAFLFLRNIGFVCFIGSCILIPYIISAATKISDSADFFFGSLIVAVLIMIALYYKAVPSRKRPRAVAATSANSSWSVASVVAPVIATASAR